MIFIRILDIFHIASRYSPPKKPQNDIALIRLKKDLKFNLVNLMPICLPPRNKFKDSKGLVYAAGWGSRHEEKCLTGAEVFVDKTCVKILVVMPNLFGIINLYKK